jgi:hypothetical protein
MSIEYRDNNPNENEREHEHKLHAPLIRTLCTPTHMHSLTHSLAHVRAPRIYAQVRNAQANACANMDTPLMQPLWAAGLSFARCHAEWVVPQDPNLKSVFTGEEFSRGARLWTAGWVKGMRACVWASVCVCVCVGGWVCACMRSCEHWSCAHVYAPPPSTHTHTHTHRYDFYALRRPVIGTYYGGAKGGRGMFAMHPEEVRESDRRMSALLKWPGYDKTLDLGM